MRIITLLLLVVFALPSISFTENEAIPDKQQEYIRTFLEAVSDHSEKKVFKLLDKKYRKEQLKFLGGNKTQLINELFGGSDMETNNYRSLLLANVLKIEVAEVILEKNGMYKYIFRVKTSDFEIFMSLSLNKKGKKYGFIGSVG